MARTEGFRAAKQSCWAPVRAGESEGTLGMGDFEVRRWGTHSLLTAGWPWVWPPDLCEAFRRLLSLPPGPQTSPDRRDAALRGWNREVPGAPCSARELPCGCLWEEGKSSEKGREPGPHH